MDEKIAELEKKTSTAAKKLEKLRDGSAQVSRDVFEKEDAKLQRALKEWRNRHKMVCEVDITQPCSIFSLLSRQ